MFKVYVLFCFLFFAFSHYIQAKEPSKKEKFNFEKLNSEKIKSVKKDTYLSLYFNDEESDTMHTATGKLISLTDSTITIEEDQQHFHVNNDSLFVDNTTYITSGVTRTYSNNEVKYIWKHAKSRYLGLYMGGAALYTALIISPLVAIDKNSSNGFNTIQYKQITFTSLFISAGGFFSEPIIDGRWLKIPSTEKS